MPGIILGIIHIVVNKRDKNPDIMEFYTLVVRWEEASTNK